MTLQQLERNKVYHWPQQGEWTYDDYARLPDGEDRYELIRGNIYLMPSPSTQHQDIAGSIYFLLRQYVQQYRLGKVYISPLDVRLGEEGTVVQPDVLFITQDRLDIVKERYIEGVPDLLIEILSPGNPRHDRRTKFRLYLEVGVKEYWIVDPEERTIEVYIPRAEIYVPLGIFGPGGQLQSELLPGLLLNVDEAIPS